MGFWLILLLFVATTILGELLRPKPATEKAKPSGLGDFSFPTATEGRVVPLIWGTNKIAGPNVIWYGDLSQVAITQKVKTGLFSSQTIVKGYRYYVGMQFGFCRGVIDSLLNIWIGEKLAFNGTLSSGSTTIVDPNFFGGDDLGQGGINGVFTLFPGTETQNPSTYLSSNPLSGVTIAGGGTGYTVNDILTVVGGTFTQAAQLRVLEVNMSGTIIASSTTGVEITNVGSYSVKPSNPVSVTGGTGSGATFNLLYGPSLQNSSGGTPAYRGSCYAVWEKGYIGNTTSIQPWAFELRRITDIPGPAVSGAQTINGADANPVNVIYEILTNTDWGLGFDPSTIDNTSFQNAGATLKNEGNGFSFVLDNVLEAGELLKLIEQQIDGIVFLNLLTNQWQINLARADYDVNTITEINSSNWVEVQSFDRASWDDTTNQVRVQFNDRNDDYKQTYAIAQDMANVRLQGGINVSVDVSYPGVKDRTLANQLAWRDLRTLSYPLAHAKVVVDRTFYSVQPFQVLAFTSTELGLTRLPMRIKSIDYGQLDDNKITLDLVQDIFAFQSPSFADPTDTSWQPPSASLQPFLATEQLAFEAPRGFLTRAFPGDDPTDRIWFAARRRGPEASYVAVERHSSGATSGPYSNAGEAFQFLLLGRLNSSLAEGTTYPTSTVLVVPTPDSQSAVETAFTDSTSITDVGTNLINLILVEDGTTFEFMLATSAQTSGGNVQLNGVYRGVLDTVQAAHAAGATVWLLCAGGGLTDTLFNPLDNVDVKLLPHSVVGVLSDTLATAISLQMQNRIRRPYPPSSLSLNSTFFGATASLEGVGSGPETYGIAVGLNRRDFRTVDEVQALTTDAASLFTDYPTANTSFHEVDVRNDPTGANTFLYTASGNTTSITLLRLHILRLTNGVLPTSLGLAIRQKHTFGGTIYASRYDLKWNFAATSGLTGQFNFGALSAGTTSNLYTATTSGTFNFVLSSAFSTGNVEYRKNGGAWTTLISTGTTTGSIAGVVATDTIEVRHGSTDPGAEKFLSMTAPGAGTNAYAVLYV